MKHLFIIVVVAAAIGLLGLGWWYASTGQTSQTATSTATTTVNSFSSCADQYNVMESHPRRCQTPAGELFVEDIGAASSTDDQIFITKPQPGSNVESPLVIEGEVHEDWLSAGKDFTVRLMANDEEIDGQVVQPTRAPQPEDTQRYAFRATTTFSVSTSTDATLVMEHGERESGALLKMPLVLETQFDQTRQERPRGFPDDMPEEMRERIRESRNQR